MEQFCVLHIFNFKITSSKPGAALCISVKRQKYFQDADLVFKLILFRPKLTTNSIQITNIFTSRLSSSRLQQNDCKILRWELYDCVE